MQNTSTDKPRTVVPRWRPLSRTPSEELASIGTRGQIIFVDPVDESLQIDNWRAEKSLAGMVDLFDHALVTGNRKLEIESAAGIISYRENAPQRILKAARQSLSDPFVSHRQSNVDVPSIFSSNDLYDGIRHLKRRAAEFPRNPLIRVEQARLHSVAGQFKSAADALRVAVGLAPDSRFVLRSLANFFCSIGDPDDALMFIRRSDRLKHDSWLQSADLAAAYLAERPISLSKSRIRDLREIKKSGIEESELISGLAWLEHENGLKTRKVNQMISAALSCPTENALAQSMWISEQLGGDFAHLHPETLVGEYAYEARSIQFFNTENYVDAEREADLWLKDQPLEVRAALSVCYTNLIQLQDYRRAAIIAERNVELHSGDWSMRNCAMLSYAYNGQIKEARKELAVLNKMAIQDEEIKVFALAGAGFISFIDGNADEGRNNYYNSALLAKKLKRPDYVINAATFWLEREVMAGLVGPDELKRDLDAIEKALSRHSRGQKRDISQTFKARKTVMLKRAATEITKTGYIENNENKPSKLLASDF